MGMQTDVKSAYRTTDGTIFGAPARIKGILISPSTSAGSLVLKDGGASGTTVFEIIMLSISSLIETDNQIEYVFFHC